METDADHDPKAGCKNLQNADFSGRYLAGADFSDADLTGANFSNAMLQSAKFCRAKLNEANLRDACLVDADLSEAELRGAHLSASSAAGPRMERNRINGNIYMSGERTAANWSRAVLQHADLRDADARNMILDAADLRGALLDGCDLRGVRARYAIVDGESFMPAASVDIRTDFTGVGLGSARFAPWIRAKLETNIRRLGWEAWYRQNSALSRIPVKLFWWLSDYGSSTRRILASFGCLVLLFSTVYIIPTQAPDWVPDTLRVQVQPFLTELDSIQIESEASPVVISGAALFIRSVYFSIVTMTTLGFGDVHAHPLSVIGQVLVSTQALLGYVLLGALITRLSVLFQSSEEAG